MQRRTFLGTALAVANSSCLFAALRDRGIWFRTCDRTLSEFDQPQRLCDDHEIPAGEWLAADLGGSVLVVWADGKTHKTLPTNTPIFDGGEGVRWRARFLGKKTESLPEQVKKFPPQSAKSP
jgi:hypothetical protein